jgi:hypothetical protein
MNSMSRNHFDDDCDPCEKKQKKENRIIMRCGSAGSASIPTIAAGTTTTAQVTSLSINTNSFCEPLVTLIFNSNLVANATFAGTVNFQITKICKNQVTPMNVGPIWTFNQGTAVAAGVSSTFTFTQCDCNSCFDDCCTYSVTVTNAGAVTGTLSITNAKLIAIVSSGESSCC